VDVAQCIRALAYLLIAVAAIVAAVNSKATEQQLATAGKQILAPEEPRVKELQDRAANPMQTRSR
jgi:hypothetical protein